MINILTEHLQVVKKILQEHIPDCDVWVFGSRLSENIKKYSDIDLVIVGQQRVEDIAIFKLTNSFQESDLPFRVDILDWNTLSDEFRSVIKENYEIIQKATTL